MANNLLILMNTWKMVAFARWKKVDPTKKKKSLRDKEFVCDRERNTLKLLLIYVSLKNK